MESLQTAIPEVPSQPYDIKDVIGPVVDNQYFFEAMPHFAKNIVIGFARHGGQTVNIPYRKASKEKKIKTAAEAYEEEFFNP